MRDRKAAGEAVNKNPIRGTCFGCCAAARDGEARAKPTSQTTMIVFLPIRACLLRFIVGCPEPFFLPLLHWLWHSWQPLDSRSRPVICRARDPPRDTTLTTRKFRKRFMNWLGG